LDGAVADPKNDKPIDLVSKSSNPRKGFTVMNRQWLSVSGVLNNALEGEPDAASIDFDCREDLLKPIVDFINMCAGVDIPEVPKPLSSKVILEVLKKSPFTEATHAPFAKFIDDIGDDDKQQLYDLVMAANFLNMKGLLHLGLAKVCTWIKGYPIGDLKHRLLPIDKATGVKLTEFRQGFSMGATIGASNVQGHSLSKEQESEKPVGAAAAVEDESASAVPPKKEKLDP